MLEMLHTQTALAERFLAHMLARNIRVEEDLVDQLFNSSEKRLARVLLLLARYGKADQPLRIPKMSQETLAEIVGTTRSRVNFFMNKFRDLGIHRIQRRHQGEQLPAHGRPARLIPILDRTDGHSCSTTLSIERWTCRPPSRSRWRSRNPRFRNVFIRWSIFDRVVPISSASRFLEMSGNAERVR